MPFNPPSLENQCFLFLLCRLEEYPVEVICLLPIRMRHKLLCNLPVVDVCQLEKHPRFVEGLDMEGVWKTIFSRRQPPGVEVEDDEKEDEGESVDANRKLLWKEHYFRIVTGLALNYINVVAPHAHLRFLMELLLFVEDCLGITDWMDFSLLYFDCDEMRLSGGVLNNGRFASFRYADYMHDHVTTTALLKLVVETCCIHPKVLHIICDYFIESDLWNQREEYKDLIKELVSQVQVVKLLFEDGVPLESTRVPSFILEAVLSREEPLFRSLVINNCSSRAMGDIILSIADLFSEVEGTHSSERVKSSYSGLHHLMLSIKLRVNERWICSAAAEKLSQIIQHQESLVSLSLCCWNPYHKKRKPPGGFLQLYSSLSNLLTQPQFDTLGLGGFAMPLRIVEDLLYRFLTCHPTRTQGMVVGALELCSMESSDQCSPGQVVMSDESIRYKCLCLVETEIPRLLTEWLFSCRKLRFKVFEVNAVDFDSQDDVFHLVAQHSDFEAESLCFHNLYISTISTTERAFEAILQKSVLKKLSLKNCDLGITAHLPHLAHGLRKQAEVGTLEYLDVSGNNIGEQILASISEVDMLFDAIFSLPQLEGFTLVIAENMLQSEHFTMLHDAWRRNAKGKKLKHLECTGNSIPENTSDLHEVTHHLVV